MDTAGIIIIPFDLNLRQIHRQQRTCCYLLQSWPLLYPSPEKNATVVIKIEFSNNNAWTFPSKYLSKIGNWQQLQRTERKKIILLLMLVFFIYLPSRLEQRLSALGTWAWINSAGSISSRISDFGGEHSASRIRHFKATF